MADFAPALKQSELAEDSMMSVMVGEVRVLLSNVGGEVSAVSGTCSHEEADLGLGFMMEDRVVCPLHLSAFNLRTGEVLNPPATAPLKRFNVKIEGGTIFVEV